MKTIKEIISSKEIRGIADYFSLYRDVEGEIKRLQLQNSKIIKIALLSSFTVKGVKETLFIKCCEIGVVPEIYVGDYNQYSQEILDSKGRLYEFKPDLIIIFIDTITLLGNNYLLPYQISNEQRKAWVDEKLKEIVSLIKKINDNSSAKILLHNFEIPLHSPLGILENKQEFGFIESIEKINTGLRDAFKRDPQVHILDYDSFCSGIGRQNIMDYKMYFLGDIKIDLQYMPELCDKYLAYIKPLVQATRKCIVLDLDNILWGGIIGEDGIKGIKLGPDPEGKPFLEFQKYLLSLFNRGVALAINSSNNPEDALKVFREHPYMILKEEHFAAMQVNWNDKISNMKAIAEEINIGMDSLVFFDDDKLNREIVSNALPEVLVVDMPEDAALYLKKLMELNEFDTYQLTEEDRKRGRMYAEQRKRNKFQNAASDITGYLKNLKMVATIKKANSFSIPRISQLTQKTNQFNMTTRRYAEEDINKFSRSDNFLVLSVKIEDKFGDNGITGAVIVEKGNEGWRIDTFLLSCRVIGRKVEEVLLANVIEQAGNEGAKVLAGEFVHTKKNAPALDFYKNNGFKLASKDSGTEVWEYDLAKKYKSPDFIKVVKR
ncbi:HAD family hydrolase [Candidatus Woesearchaeota archaeon]|nr:HAD family hydrolase [Candidatus Woesearchaeota archaeon]